MLCWNIHSLHKWDGTLEAGDVGWNPILVSYIRFLLHSSAWFILHWKCSWMIVLSWLQEARQLGLAAGNSCMCIHHIPEYWNFPTDLFNYMDSFMTKTMYFLRLLLLIIRATNKQVVVTSQVIFGGNTALLTTLDICGHMCIAAGYIQVESVVTWQHTTSSLDGPAVSLLFGAIKRNSEAFSPNALTCHFKW